MIGDCTIPECVTCQWIADRIIRFNDDLKALLLATAPPPITVKLWVSGDLV